MLIPWSLGLVERYGRAPGACALLVHGTSDRLLLAAAGLHVLVHPRAPPGGRQALQRSARPHVLHPVPRPLDPTRLPPPVRRSGHPSSLEAGPCLPDVRGLLPEPPHVLQRRRVTRERSPRTGGPRLGGLVREAALGRPVGRRAGPGDAPVRLRRGGRPHQRLVQPEPGRPQYGLDPGPSPPDGGHRRHPVVHGHHLLAGSRPPGPRPLEPSPGARPDLALVRRDGGLLARPAQPWPPGRAAAHDAERRSVRPPRVALGSHVGRDRQAPGCT